MTKLAFTAPLLAMLPLKEYCTAASVGSGFQLLWVSDLRVMKFPSSCDAQQLHTGGGGTGSEF